MEAATTRSTPHVCPCCGRSTPLTTYGPEPSLCVDCQKSFGLLQPLPVRVGPDPDDPQWGIPEAAGIFLASVLALLAGAQIFVVAYMIYAGREGIVLPSGEEMLQSPGLVMASILGSGVGHVVTIALAWLVVTNGGRESFFRSIGWGWQRGIGPVSVMIAFGGVYAANLAFALVFQWLDMVPENTPFEQVLGLSFATRLAISVFAVVSAPFVEEVVFRGIIYPALARRTGRIAAILVVSALFLGVHVAQYDGSAAFLLPLGLLSIVLTTLRAVSGSVMPSFALHLVFNLCQVALIMSGAGR